MHAYQLLFALIFAFAGFRRAQWFGQKYGRTPWGWNPWIWAVIFFLIVILGFVLLALAERSGRKAAQERDRWTPPGMPPNGPTPGAQWPGAEAGGRRY